MGLNNSRSSACLIVESRLECLPADVLWRIFSSIHSDVSKLHLEMVNRYFQILARTYCWKYLKTLRISSEHVNHLQFQIWDRSAATSAVDHVLPNVSQSRLRTIELSDSELGFLELPLKRLIFHGKNFPNVKRIVLKNLKLSSIEEIPESTVHLINTFANSITSLVIDFSTLERPSPSMRIQAQKNHAIYMINLWNSVTHCKNLKELRFFEIPWLEDHRFHRIAPSLEGKCHLNLINLNVSNPHQQEDFVRLTQTARSLQHSLRTVGVVDGLLEHFTTAVLSEWGGAGGILESFHSLIFKHDIDAWVSAQLPKHMPALKLIVCYDKINGILFSTFLRLHRDTPDARLLILAQQIDGESLSDFDTLADVKIEGREEVTEEEWVEIRRTVKRAEVFGIADRRYVNLSKMTYGLASVILLTQGFLGPEQS